MPPDITPQLSLGTAALVIFALCFGFILLRGLARILLGTAALAASAWLAFMVWQAAPEFSLMLFGKSAPWFNTGLPAAVFIIAWLLLRMVIRQLCGFFSTPHEDRLPARRSFFGLAVLLMLALIPTAVLWLMGVAVVHHFGAIAEVREYANPSEPARQGLLNRQSIAVKSSIEPTILGSWLRKLDPLADPARLKLAKIIGAQSKKPLEPVIDPATGKPIPRAIIVEDPELQNLAREGKFGTLLHHPLLTKTLNDPKIKAFLKDLNL